MTLVVKLLISVLFFLTSDFSSEICWIQCYSKTSHTFTATPTLVNIRNTIVCTTEHFRNLINMKGASQDVIVNCRKRCLASASCVCCSRWLWQDWRLPGKFLFYRVWTSLTMSIGISAFTDEDSSFSCITLESCPQSHAGRNERSLHGSPHSLDFYNQLNRATLQL